MRIKMLKMMLKMMLKVMLKMMARKKERSKELDRAPRGGGPVGVRLERTTRKNNPKPVGEREVDHEVEVAEDEETTIEADGAEVLIKNTNTIHQTAFSLTKKFVTEPLAPPTKTHLFKTAQWPQWQLAYQL